MKQKGFTLIELIAVIVILALIALVVFPAITSILKSSRDKAYKAEEQVIIKAAKKYYLDNVNEKLYEYLDPNDETKYATLYKAPTDKRNEVLTFDEYCQNSDSDISPAGEEILIDKLISEGYIAGEELNTENQIINPKTNKAVCGKVKVSYACTTHQYVYEFEAEECLQE